MNKKIVGIVIAFILMLCTSYVLATNDVGDSMNKATNTARDVVGGAENVVEDAAGDIGAGIRDLGNTFSDGASRVNNDQTTDDYTTTRTATTNGANGNFLGMSANAWTWFILAIVAIAIVGLVWYYAMQNSNEYTNSNDNH